MYGKTYEITVQESTESKDSGGEITDSWSEKGTVKGRIWQLKGDEQYQSSKDTRIIRYRMSCDNPSITITEDDRIQYNSINYDIEVVNNVSMLDERYLIDLKEVD